MVPKKKPTKPLKECTLLEAATEYFINLTTDEVTKAQPEIIKFIRWFGETRITNSLTAPEIENYSENLTATIKNLPEKINPVKDFLSFAYKQGYLKIRLAHLLKSKSSTTKTTQTIRRHNSQPIYLTREGYASIKAELESLLEERPKIVEEIRKAAADKDFRENAPLEAAKEYQGKIESRIRELEAILKSAIIINETADVSRGAKIGDTVVLRDPSTNDLLTYTLVDIKEANPSAGKVSVNSPIGKALVGHKVGDKIEVNAPAGIIPYYIEEIK